MTRNTDVARELVWEHAVRDVPERGLSSAREATPDELAAAASALDLLACKSLAATYSIVPTANGRYHLSGTLRAEVVQACVVTLEPIEAEVRGDFERRYLPRAEFKPGEASAHDIQIDPEGEDPAEILEREIDVGEILVEELSLALDPYPRKLGVEFVPQQDTVAKPENPFAVLAKPPVKGGKGKRRP